MIPKSLPETISWYSTEKKGSSHYAILCMYPVLERAKPLPLVEQHINDLRVSTCYTKIFKQTKSQFASEEAAELAAQRLATASNRTYIKKEREISLVFPLSLKLYGVQTFSNHLHGYVSYDRESTSINQLMKHLQKTDPSLPILISPTIPYHPELSPGKAPETIAWLSVIKKNGAYHVTQKVFPTLILKDGKPSSTRNDTTVFNVYSKTVPSFQTKEEAINMAKSLPIKSPLVLEDQPLYCLVPNGHQIECFAILGTNVTKLFDPEAKSALDYSLEIKSNDPTALILVSPMINLSPSETRDFPPVKKVKTESF